MGKPTEYPNLTTYSPAQKPVDLRLRGRGKFDQVKRAYSAGVRWRADVPE
jgi:hypothetical protein